MFLDNRANTARMSGLPRCHINKHMKRVHDKQCRRPNIHIDYNSIEIERVTTNIIEIPRYEPEQ